VRTVTEVQQRTAWSTERLRREIVTPSLVTGTVLVSVFIAVADEDNGIGDVFAVTLLSVFVYWVTEVYVYTITALSRDDTGTLDWRTSLRAALRKSRGFLLAGLPPLVFLVLGLFGVNDGRYAYWVALWVGVALLAAIGWVAFAKPGAPWYRRAGGALMTAAFGLLAIALKILVH
jgi:hypothetical protein